MTVHITTQYNFIRVLCFMGSKLYNNIMVFGLNSEKASVHHTNDGRSTVNETIHLYNIIWYIVVAYSVPRTGRMGIKDRDGVGAISYTQIEVRKKKKGLFPSGTPPCARGFYFFFSSSGKAGVWGCTEDLFFHAFVYTLVRSTSRCQLCSVRSYTRIHVHLYTYKFIYLLRRIVAERIVNSKSLAHSRLAVHIKFDCSGPPPPLDSAARLVDPPGDRAVCIKSNYDVRY